MKREKYIFDSDVDIFPLLFVHWNRLTTVLAATPLRVLQPRRLLSIDSTVLRRRFNLKHPQAPLQPCDSTPVISEYTTTRPPIIGRCFPSKICKARETEIVKPKRIFWLLYFILII